MKGGSRKGAGRPVGTIKGTKKRFLINIDKDNEDFFYSLPNKSKYLNDLLRKAKESPGY